MKLNLTLLPWIILTTLGLQAEETPRLEGIYSDSSWVATKMEVPGWTDIDFDDSDWTSVFVMRPSNVHWPNSYDIWGHDESLWSVPNIAHYRKSFLLPNVESIDSAIIRAGADDDVHIYVNGELVFEESTGRCGPGAANLDVSHLLRAGKNVIALWSRDMLCCGRTLRFAMDLSYKEEVVTEPAILQLDPTGIYSDSSWISSSEEHPGWQEPGFADDDWGSVHIQGGIHPSWPNSYNIWGQNESLWKVPNVAYYRKAFVLTDPGKVESALVRAGANDDVRVYINGHLVYEETNGVYGPDANNLEVARHLKKGKNVIALWSRDQLCCGRALRFALNITYVNEELVPVADLSLRAESASEPGGVTQGLVAYYPFNGNAHDASGNEYHGTVKGATLAEDRFGKPSSAYSFDGINDNIHFPLPNVGNPSGQVTWSGWFKTTAVHPKTTFFLVSTGACGIFMKDAGVHCSCEIGRADRKSVRTIKAFNDGEWHFVALTYDNEWLRFYVDCKMVGKVKDGVGLIDYDGVKGYYAGQAGSFYEYFKGAIDDIRVYDRPLSEEELTLLCQDRPMNVEDVKEPSAGEPLHIALDTIDRTEMALSLFPNPTSGLLKFTLEQPVSSEATIRIYDATGRMIREESHFAEELLVGSLNTSDLASGSYFLSVTTTNGSITKRFVKS